MSIPGFLFNNAYCAYAARKMTRHFIEEPGKHRLKVWLIDTGVYFDRFILDFGGLKESYLGPADVD